MVTGIEDTPARPNLRLVSGPSHPEFEAGRIDRRFFASILDGMIFSVMLTPVSVVGAVVQMVAAAGNKGKSDPFGSLLVVLTMFASWGIRLVVMYFYYGWFYQNKGGSPGKLLLGIKVVDAKTGLYLTYGKAFLRETIGKVASLSFGVGYLMAFFRKDRRALHDLIADSQTLYEKAS